MFVSSVDWRATDPLNFVSDPGLRTAAARLLHARGYPVTVEGVEHQESD